MNILTFTLLQASAPAGAGQPQGAGGGAFWIVIIAMFVIMWLFMIRPQRKQQKELEKFRNSLKRGDKVVTPAESTEPSMRSRTEPSSSRLTVKSNSESTRTPS